MLNVRCHDKREGETTNGRRFRRLRPAGLEDGPGRDRGPIRAVRGDDARGQGRRRDGRLRLRLGLRPLPHRPRADHEYRLRGVDDVRGSCARYAKRQDRPDGHLQRLPQPRAARQDRLDGRRDEQRTPTLRPGCRLVRAGVARLRLRLPRGPGKDEDVQGGVRDRPPHVHRGRPDVRRRVLSR